MNGRYHFTFLATLIWFALASSVGASIIHIKLGDLTPPMATGEPRAAESKTPEPASVPPLDEHLRGQKVGIINLYFCEDLVIGSVTPGYVSSETDWLNHPLLLWSFCEGDLPLTIGNPWSLLRPPQFISDSC